MTKKNSMKKINENWGTFEIAENNIYFWQIGDLKLWCKRSEDELQIAYNHNKVWDKSTPEADDIPEDKSWSRWSFKKSKKIEIKISPQFPDRPVVVKPESSFSLAKGTSAKIYIRIPLWIRIELAGKSLETVLELPAVTLSNTWFGTFFEGELCYWISTGARRTIEPDAERPYLAISPHQLINTSEEDLLIEKICLRVSNLSLFSHKDQLWSDETKIYYKGKNKISQVKTSGKPPSEVNSAQLISRPRIPEKQSLVAKTFASLKELPSLGISGN